MSAEHAPTRGGFVRILIYLGVGFFLGNQFFGMLKSAQSGSDTEPARAAAPSLRRIPLPEDRPRMPSEAGAPAAPGADDYYPPRALSGQVLDKGYERLGPHDPWTARDLKEARDYLEKMRGRLDPDEVRRMESYLKFAERKYIRQVEGW